MDAGPTALLVSGEVVLVASAARVHEDNAVGLRGAVVVARDGRRAAPLNVPSVHLQQAPGR